MSTTSEHGRDHESHRAPLAVVRPPLEWLPPDWEATPLGPLWSWPHPLRHAATLIAELGTPAIIWWGEGLVQIYNAAAAPFYSAGVPSGLGLPVRTAPPAGWSTFQPAIERVLMTGAAAAVEGRVQVLGSHGRTEMRQVAASFSPVREARGNIGGVLGLCHDVTARVVAERRQALLGDLAMAVAREETVAQVGQAAAAIMGKYPDELPFGLLYLADADSRFARLAGSAGDCPVPPPSEIDLSVDSETAPLPIARVLATGQTESLANNQFLVPLTLRDSSRPVGVLLAGAPSHTLDADDTRAFFDRIAACVAAAVDSAEALAGERRRNAVLAALEEAKVAFSADVHKQLLGTLSLLLQPLQSLLTHTQTLTAEQRELLDIAHRACLQLLKQANALLQFTRLEAGRLTTDRQATDLARFTADLAGLFRQVAADAGLGLRIDCQPLPGPVWIDRAMWEKIVLNLLSNAIKYTHRGEVAVMLRQAADGAGVVLVVRDTGIGIPPSEVAHLFERHRRVRVGGGRTSEGLGLGLSLVREMVRLHDGSVAVESAVGRGSSFIVTVPLQAANLSSQDATSPPKHATPVAPTPYVAEARRWLATPGPAPVGASQPSNSERVLIAVGSRELRRYLRWLLSGRWLVATAEDHDAALAAVRADPPALVLTDMALTNSAGVGLARALRDHPSTATLPVILLTPGARGAAADQHAAVAADEHLAMPFSADELLARVQAHIDLGRARREARELREEFIAVVAHDLRTPLTSIQLGLGLLDLQAETGSLSTEARTMLGALRRNAQRLAIHVGDLITANQLGAGILQLDRRPLDLRDAVRDAVEVVRPLFDEKGQAVRLALPQRLTTIGDAHWLEQVLVNLLANAHRHTPSGTRVLIAGHVDATTIELSVRDTGPGIPEHELENVFERHRRLAPGDGGSGLGLSTARRLIALHGGRIWAERPKGRGVRIGITLPRGEVCLGADGRLDDAPVDRR